MNSFERILSMDTLYRSWEKISRKNASGGSDGVDINFYSTDLQKNLRALQTSVASGNYRPYAEIIYADHKDRAISISCVEDKIIQAAIAEIIITSYTPAECVHGFIPKRSVFTAKQSLDNAISEGVYDYSKVDIKHFYGSIDRKILISKVKAISSDTKFIDLVELLINARRPGISMGSCLPPAISNLCLADFDREIENNSVFFSRYVDDMLVAPACNIEMIKQKLAEVGLEVHTEKSKHVNAAEGFNYLGFDIKQTIDSALQSGDFALAEELYTVQESDIQAEESSAPKATHEAAVESAKSEYEIPNTIRNVVNKCHIVKSIVEKARTQQYIGFAEKTHLLQIFHCLGEAGTNFIHHVLSHCSDYDYAETRRRINKYDAHNPLGCKKLCERVGSNDGCACNFTSEKLYPTPILHALRVDRECFKPTDPKDNIGHFKARNPRDKAVDALSSMLELNKKQYEITEQQKILKGQIEDLFERANTRELMTPQGLMFKTEEGIFIKVG